MATIEAEGTAYDYRVFRKIKSDRLLGGVQKRHYDQHDYLEEKRAALQLWASHLAALKAGTVIGAPARVESKIAGAAST